MYSFGAEFSLGRMGIYCGLKCVITSVILKTLCCCLLQVSPHCSQDWELEKEDASSFVKPYMGLTRRSISKSKYIFKSLLQNRVFYWNCHTSVSCTGKKTPCQRMVMYWLPCPQAPHTKRFFFQVHRRRENDAFNAKHRSYTSSSPMCIFFFSICCIT